jgi:hypothetical protein
MMKGYRKKKVTTRVQIILENRWSIPDPLRDEIKYAKPHVRNIVIKRIAGRMV